eukprot:CAMPEP_0185783692 /NCGR_PEP_ID=MMETSP1174-20130828/118504_1 /TAXON_ID=35687 /ORGANISM="Dictyocha speculum, Strain CCMP1381" /LENGTH=40 /DNA_ID= /DNA_START= /DNA_END= /DNA_ORIENTATION=
MWRTHADRTGSPRARWAPPAATGASREHIPAADSTARKIH